MKKIICLLSAILILAATSFAQSNDANKKAPAKKTEARKPNSTNKETAKGLRKDGTPDKRYKENKEAAKPAQKLKKDGTPDKRYKNNQTAK